MPPKTVLDLLVDYSRIIIELCDRGVLRSVNNPVADYAEYLASKALGLTRASLSTKGHDAIDENGKRYEIKSRRLTRKSKPTRFSAIRKLEEDHFDFLIAILFNENFTVNKAAIFPKDFVIKKSFWQKHVNAYILPIDNELWNSESGKDILSEIINAQSEGNLGE